LILIGITLVLLLILKIEKRLAEHNSGKTKSTKPYIPWEILFYEEYDNKADALKREKYLKSGVGREYVKNKYLAS